MKNGNENATRFAKAVEAMFEADGQWSIFDLDGAAEFFAEIGFVPSTGSVEVEEVCFEHNTERKPDATDR